MKYEIKTYKTASGQEVVWDFIKGMQSSARARLARSIGLLESFGPELSMPHAKMLGDGLYELRVRGKQEVRIFYVYAKGRDIHLLHGFVKKTQKTPKKELEIARQRQAEIKKS